ncbi:MAG: YqjD family protein [Gammaproteobacteria bacterium]
MIDTTTNTSFRSNGAANSLNGSASNVQSDVKTLVRDAQSLLQAAATLTGEKADDLRKRGMDMLDVALGKASQYQGQALEKGKELAQTADVYVKDNPWRTVAAAAGVGLLVGVILGRK